MAKCGDESLHLPILLGQGAGCGNDKTSESILVASLSDKPTDDVLSNEKDSVSWKTKTIWSKIRSYRSKKGKLKESSRYATQYTSEEENSVPERDSSTTHSLVISISPVIDVYREHYTDTCVRGISVCVKHGIVGMPGLQLSLKSLFDAKRCSNLNGCKSLSLSPSHSEVGCVQSNSRLNPLSVMPSNREVSYGPTTTWDSASTSNRSQGNSVYGADQSLIDSVTPLLHAHDFTKILLTVGSLSLDSHDPSLAPPLFISGLSYFKLSKYSDARKHFSHCEEICTSVNVKGDVSLCSVYMGDIEFSSQHYLKSAEHYIKAASHYSEINMAGLFRMVPPSLSSIHAKCGSALRNGSKMVDAVQAYKMAIKEAKGDRDLLASNTSVGNLYQSLGENDSALKHYEKCVELSFKLEDNVSLGWAHGNMGNAYLGLFKKDKALYHLQKSLDLTVVHEPTPQAIGRTFNNLGTAYQSIGELDKAEEHYNHALSQAIYGNDRAGQARVYGNIGNVLMLRKKYKMAIPHYTEVLSLSKDRSTISTAHHNRGCAYYEWAEDMRENKPLSGVAIKDIHFHIHGPLFKGSDRHPCEVTGRVAELYRNGSEDLEEVVKYHEAYLSNIKGSSNGLTLSVSLFETNSRTFHRYQDCLVSLGEYTQALVVAEQSRARTLGELMLKRKEWSLPIPLKSPLPFEQISSAIASKIHPILYLSYTGARLLGWVFTPGENGEVKMNMFEVPLKDDQFDGKSFDYHLRYNLTDMLVERSFEMYRGVEYNEDSSKPVQNLYDLIATPLLCILKAHDVIPSKLIIISDSYTALLPYASLHDSKTDTFLGDTMRFQLMPSLLTMYVLDQLPDTNVVRLPEDTHNMCIAGNPSIPPFYYNKELWHLGKLPHAKKEAEWVAHILKTTPILDEQATKSSVLLRIMSAKVIHLATHGSASAGFLAFGSISSLKEKDAIEAESVLLYPKDIEKLNISPALVVLSSCDSGRGMVKADGIQGMARAFILAGAQAVLTTLWRVPDESAAVFMQFFYQYMVDGLESTLALQKAILSIRCYSKYSQYIHWSGYQLTGRDVYIKIMISNSTHILNRCLGPSTTFPRLMHVKLLEASILDSPCYPTDVQILQGYPGVKPSEIVIDFIHNSYKQFRGGIFWINCKCPELMFTSISYIEKCIGVELDNFPADEANQCLFVFDGMTKLPESESLLTLMRSRYAHSVVLYYHYLPPDKLIRAIDHKLLRGSKVIRVDALTMIHSTQRMVYTIQRGAHFAPSNHDQAILENLSDFTSGSPVLVDITSHILLSYLKDNTDEENLSQLLRKFSISLNVQGPTILSSCVESDNTSSECDSVTKLVNSCKLGPEARLLLNCLSVFGCTPTPHDVVTSFSSLITTSSGRYHLAPYLLDKLIKMKLVETYPMPVIFHSMTQHTHSSYPELVCVPQHVATFLWKDLDHEDRMIALATSYHVLSHFTTSSHFLSGLTSILVDAFHLDCDLMGEDCYKNVYRLYLMSFK